MGPENRKCPSEIYGMAVAGDVLPSIYQSQAECGELLGCQRDGCPLDKRWPTDPAPSASGSTGNLWPFVVTALMGPRRP